MVKLIKGKLFQYLRKKINKYNMVLNINKDLTKKQKSIAISYINNSMCNNLDKDIYHSQLLEVNQIIKEFINRDYVIDLIHCNEINSLEFIKYKNYDVVFGLGDVFYELCKLNTKAKKIIYVTENHPNFSYKKEKERVNYYYFRHRKKIKMTRSGEYYKNEHFNNIDLAIIMGEKKYFESNNFEIITIEPTGLINKDYVFKQRKTESSKCNFLWMGSYGAVHKGLDLLIDIFSKRDDINLYICGLHSKDRKYVKIPNKNNIKDYGIINVNSEIFLDIVSKCNFIILPSCSEALSTSVLTGMLHGMIPIVLKDSGFNRLKENALFLDDFSVEYIDKKLTEILNLQSKIIQELEQNVYTFAREQFTIQAYTEKFRGICNYIKL